MSVDLSQFGAPVDIQPPPDDDVFDATQIAINGTAPHTTTTATDTDTSTTTTRDAPAHVLAPRSGRRRRNAAVAGTGRAASPTWAARADTVCASWTAKARAALGTTAPKTPAQGYE